MNDQTILDYSKELTLDFLKKIGADIDNSHELYTVMIPTKYESVFGGITKRITFDHEVADTHSCELVVPGSNFLAIILGEIKKEAPVIGGHLKKQIQSPEDCLDQLSTHNCHMILEESTEEMRIAIRFYFNIVVKSIKSISMLRWIDVDFETLALLDFPAELELDPDLGTIKYEKGDPKIDHCYSKAAESLENEVEPLAVKYSTKSQDSYTQDINSLNQVHTKRLNEIRDDVAYQKSKLREFDRKILKARQHSTQEKYVVEKQKQNQKIKKAEENAIKQIERLTVDKEAQIQQIEKRHKPVIDFSLIAGTVYSYSTSKCKILLKNQYTQKEIYAKFLEPAQEFSVICEVCSMNTETTHLCINSHAVCDLCVKHCVKCKKDVCVQCPDEFSPCYICKEGLCSDCSINCHFCQERTCDKHLMQCPHCSEVMCFFCADSCQYCNNKFCNASIISCNLCHNRTCKSDSKQCIDCKNQFCPKDVDVCVICNGIHCRNDSSKCKLCEQSYSRNCLSNDLCSSCSKISEVEKENPSVQAAILADSDLVKYKKWELAENSKYCIFKAKKMFGSKIIVYHKELKKIIVDKKGGWR